MKLPIIDLENKKIGEKQMPKQFEEEVRPDLVHRAVITVQKNKRQPYGAAPTAGKRHQAKLSRRRRDYKTSYGIGISRVPRKIMSRRGTRMNWVGAVAPGTVGGRQAHPPKATKNLVKKINLKEKRKAIRSALHATLIKEYVQERGHKIPQHYPFVLDTSVEQISKTKDVELVLRQLGLAEELERSSVKKIRSGKGKLRARKYRRKTGPLLVVSKDCSLIRAAGSLPGIDVVTVNNLNAELLAPGTKIGRLTLFTEAALTRLDKEKLFA